MSAPLCRKCACGCNTLVFRRYGRLRKFADRAHYARALAGPDYAEYRHRRAKAAGAAARIARHKRAVADAKKYPSKAAAWSAGHRCGYSEAYRYFRAKWFRQRQG